MAFPRRFPVSRFSAVALALMLAGCGGGGSSPSSPTSTPTRSRSVIGSFSFSLVGIPAAQRAGFGFDFLGQTVTLGTAGDLDAVVDWTFASNDVNVYLTSDACTDAQFKVVACSIMRSTENVSGKPKTMPATTLSAGNYKIWVVNLGNTSESGTVQVGVTR
jgi:hypothetical protein